MEAVGKHRNLALGVTLIVTAFFFSAMTGFVAKFTHQAPVTVTVFLQYAVSFALFLPLAFKRGTSGLQTKHLALHVVRSLAGSGAQLLFFLALAGLPLLDASLLANASPLFIPLIVLVWLHKPIRASVWGSLAIGLAGVILVIHPGPELLHDPASFIALLSAILSAIGLTTTNTLAESEPPYRILFYNFGISSTVLAALAAFTWKPIATHVLLLLLVIGVLYASTQYCIILAYRYADATALSPFNYSVVIFSGILGWLFLGNIPSAGAIIGTALICAGGILSIVKGHHEGLGHPVGSGHWVPRWRASRSTERNRFQAET